MTITDATRRSIAPYPSMVEGHTLRVVAYCPHCEQMHELAPLPTWELALICGARGWTLPGIDERLEALARDLPEAPCVPCILAGGVA